MALGTGVAEAPMVVFDGVGVVDIGQAPVARAMVADSSVENIMLILLVIWLH